jgi:hypothetical protein
VSNGRHAASLAARSASSSIHRSTVPPPGNATPACERQSASPSTVRTCHASTRAGSTDRPVRRSYSSAVRPKKPIVGSMAGR